MSLILQKEVTLDSAMLNGFKTFRNGCNFKLKTKADDTKWIGYGCYALVNLMIGEELLLHDFLENEMPLEKMENMLSGDVGWRRIDHLVRPETILELLKREPCSRCGGFVWQQANAPSTSTARVD